MNVVGRVGSLISQGVYTVATPFHPFGGAVDIIVVEQQDGTYRSTPWYVRFGKFQGVLKGAEKLVRISVNGVEADFHMYLDNSGEAYFTREVESGNDNENNQDLKCSDLLATSEDHKVCIENSFENDASDSEGAGASNRNDDMNTHQNGSMEFHDNQSQTSSCGSPRFGTYHYESLDHVEDLVNSQGSDSEVVLVSGDGHVLLAPISSSDDNADNLELITPLFELYPGEGGEETVEHLENSTGFSRHSVELKTDGRTWDVGIQSDGGGQSSSSTEGVDPVFRSNSRYQDENEENSSNENNGDTSSVHCNQDDADSTMNRLEAFKSCLEFSQLTSEMEADNMQDDDTTSVRLVEGSAAYNGQEQCLSSSVVMDKEQGGSPAEVKTSICIPVSCSSSSVTDQIQMFDSEDNALLDEKSEFEAFQSVPNDSIHSNMNQKDEELKPLGGCQESASIEAHEDIDCQTGISQRSGSGLGFEISLCGNLLHAGMGVDSASVAFNAHRITEAEYKASGATIIKNENLIVRFRGRYFSWDTAAPIILGMAVFGLDETAGMQDAIPIEQDEKARLVEENISELSSTPSRRWRLWPNPFRRTSSKPLQHTSSSTSNEDDFVDTESFSPTPNTESTDANSERPNKQMLRTNIPTSEQIASLSLRDGQNKIAFIFSTRVLGEQQVDAHIYLWKWNARIVISDVDGTITKSDVLGQFMPLLGKDWTQSGVARLFSAIKENGYQLLFLSARAIVQAYLTRSFLLNLKQDGKALPNGPVVISPDGLFPSLYREVILRRPHEFKIACLEDIRALFPSDYNPFYAGFGNRETDEISYRKMGIPKGKIFIINPKGEVAVHRCIDAKSYTSLHTLVNDMFPPTSLAEQEDFNSWNFWKVPLPSIDC